MAGSNLGRHGAVAWARVLMAFVVVVAIGVAPSRDRTDLSTFYLSSMCSQVQFEELEQRSSSAANIWKSSPDKLSCFGEWKIYGKG